MIIVPVYTFAEEIKTEEKNTKSFLSFNLGQATYEDVNGFSGTTNQIGLTGGMITNYSEKIGGKWFVGFDTGADTLDNSSYRLTDIMGGYDAVIYLGTPMASFNIGGLVALNHLKYDFKNENLKTGDIALGADASFSVFIIENFGLDLGARFMFPVYKFDARTSGNSGINWVNGLQNEMEFYLGLVAYL